MTVLERPRGGDLPTPLLVPEAIIPEARRRGRRRRAFSILGALAAVGVLSGVGVVILQSARASTRISHSRWRSGARTGPRGAPDMVVAWADYAGVFHLGDVATHRQLTIASFPGAESGSPVAVDRGRLLWVDARERIRSVDIATGRASVVARGSDVIESPDRSRLYVARRSGEFLELNARTSQVTRTVKMPARWTTDAWLAAPIAGGFVLARAAKHGLVLGIWHPGNSVRQLGAAVGVTDGVYTAPNGRYSLVAWVPECATRDGGFGSRCPLAITNTATHETVRVPSPSHYGFTGGSFSPDGTELATFVNTDNPSDPSSTPRSVLAIVNTATGALRLDPKVKLVTTEDAAWATWLPPGRQLLAGAIDASYLVNTRTLATRGFYFDGAATRLQSIMNSPDLNFSTVVVPPGALSVKQRQALGLDKKPGVG